MRRTIACNHQRVWYARNLSEELLRIAHHLVDRCLRKVVNMPWADELARQEVEEGVLFVPS